MASAPPRAASRGAGVAVRVDGGVLEQTVPRGATLTLPAGRGVLLEDGPGWSWVPVGRVPPEDVAQRLAARGASRVLVACPGLVSPTRVLLAFAAGQLLASERVWFGAGPVPVVLCPVRPLGAWEDGGVIVPHGLVVDTPGGRQDRVVWEILRARRVPAWLESLRLLRHLEQGCSQNGTAA